MEQPYIESGEALLEEDVESTDYIIYLETNQNHTGLKIEKNVTKFSYTTVLETVVAPKLHDCVPQMQKINIFF